MGTFGYSPPQGLAGITAAVANSLSSSAYPLLAPNGSISAPSYSFSSNSAAGMYMQGTAIKIQMSAAQAGSPLVRDSGVYLEIVNRTETGYSSVAAGNFNVPSSGLFRFVNSTDATTTASVDGAIGRNAAGVLEINNGTAGTYRDLKLRSIIATSAVQIGTSPTNLIGFFGATAASQGAAIASLAAFGSGAVAFSTSAERDLIRTQLNLVINALTTVGLIA